MSVRPPEDEAPLPLGKPPPVLATPAQPVRKDWLDVLPLKAEECLRDYQRQQIAQLALALRSYLRILMQAPTGAGKTHIIAAIVMAAVSADMRVLVIATRSRLARQIHERLAAFDVVHGVIAAPFPELLNHNARVQVASVDTLYRRALVDGKMPLPSADVAIFDEAHLSTAATRLRVLDSYPKAVRVGFTATPARRSGRSLGAAFDCLIPGPSIKALTAGGVLTHTKIYNTPLVTDQELRALPKDNDNDYQPKALGELLSRPKLIGDVVENWLRVASGKRTLVFGVNKGHVAALLQSFRRQGVAAEMLTDDDDEQTREDIIGRLETGDTTVIVNCFLLSYGVDVPSVECIILARPTRSLTMFLQMCGRGLRAYPGKTHCIVMDHGHCVETLGLPQSDYPWTLDPARNVNTETLSAHCHEAQESPRTCSECKAMWLTSECGNTCPECGWVAQPKPKPVIVEEADLQELTDDEVISPADARVLAFYREACGWKANRKPQVWSATPNKLRWAAWAETRVRFGIAETVGMPRGSWDVAPLAPSRDVAGWLHYRSIKYARGKARAGVCAQPS